MAPGPRLTLPRSRRIRDRRDFRALKERGNRLAHGSIILNWKELPANSGPRLGVVTARSVGGAVDRNRARRLLREAFRLHQHRLRRPADIILVARPSLRGRSYGAVERDYLNALQKARLLDSVPPAGTHHP